MDTTSNNNFLNKTLMSRKKWNYFLKPTIRMDCACLSLSQISHYQAPCFSLVDLMAVGCLAKFQAALSYESTMLINGIIINFKRKLLSGILAISH